MKKKLTLEKELNYYIKKQLDTVSDDKQDCLHFIKLLDENYDLIIANANDFNISSKFNSLSENNIAFFKEKIVVVDEDGDEKVHEGIQLYVIDGNGRRRTSTLCRTFASVECTHDTNEDCDKIIAELKTKYYAKLGRVFETFKEVDKTGFTEMSYSEYKNKYATKMTLKNSYDAVNKTIFVKI